MVRNKPRAGRPADNMSIFDTINTEATKVRATVSRVIDVDWSDYEAYSANVEPSEDFALAVAPATITPRGYQLAAVEAVTRLYGDTFARGIVGFAPGMGKTIVAQAAVAHHLANHGGRAICVVPPTLKLDPWVREFNKEFPHLKVALVEGQKQADFPADADVVILPDSIIAHRADDAIAFGANILVVDETHRFKNRDAKRTIGLTKVAEKVDAVETPNMIIGLTGTLAVNRPQEIWAPINILGAGRTTAISGGKTWSAFMNRWCETETIMNPKTGRQVKVATGIKPEKMEQLHETLKGACYVRVERDEVLDMPDKVWAVRNLSLQGAALRTYKRAEARFLDWLRETQGDAAAERAAKAEAITKMTALRKEAAKAKIEVTAEYVSQLVAEGEQVVLMGWHTAALGGVDNHTRVWGGVEEALVEAGLRVVKVVGGMTAAAKTDAVDMFKAGEADVLLGQIVAAGTGLNLENSAHLVFMELPWSPGDLIQASDRIYRVTQQRDCTVHVLNAISTIDDTLWARINAKAQVIDRVNSGAPGATIDYGSVEEAVLEYYQHEASRGIKRGE